MSLFIPIIGKSFPLLFAMQKNITKKNESKRLRVRTFANAMLEDRYLYMGKNYQFDSIW